MSKQEPLNVGPNHPAWTAFEDDDWNGGTFGQWLLYVKGCEVRLQRPEAYDKAKYKRLVRCLKRAGASKIVHVGDAT